MIRTLATLLLITPGVLAANEPQGSARAALDNPAFTWVNQDTKHFRVHFAADSYPAAHRDELVERVEAARRDNLALLGANEFQPMIDVFFIESRAQMDSLVGSPVTGLADRDARAVFLVTNPEWRAFERHEIMHVLAHHVWGPSSGAWIEEGLAQFADGRCGDYTIHDVVRALARADGYVPIATLVEQFRELDDLTAYLQAASMVGYLYETRGREAVRAVWQNGVDALSKVAGETPSAFAESWWKWVRERAKPVPSDQLQIISEKGCG